jgi:hypothetical protein
MIGASVGVFFGQTIGNTLLEVTLGATGAVFIGWFITAAVLDLPFYMVTVTGISIVATWLYNKTGGSVLLTMVFHASVNASQSLYPIEEMFTRTGEYARTIAWILLVLGLILIPRAGFFNQKRGSHPHPQDFVATPVAGE